LRVGDDVATHQNSEIFANGSIDIFGDYLNLDPGDGDTTVDGTYNGWGTTMILRGRIVADCVVNPAAPASGDPAGTCPPSPDSPVPTRIPQIWGNDDIDIFQFGDESGIPTYTDEKTDFRGINGKTTTSPGFVFIGSKTIVRGGRDVDPSG